jgi:adenine-specific DNA-methyltransferase
LFYSNNEKLKSVGRLEHTQKQKNRYSERDNNGNAFLWENFRKTGTDSNRADRPRQYYPIFVDENKLIFRIPSLDWNQSLDCWVLAEEPLQHEQIIYPLTETGEEKVWKWGIDRVLKNPEQIKIERNGSDIQIYRMNYYNDEGSLPNTWWDDAKYAAGSHGTNLLTDIFGYNRAFQFPKSIFAEMDCLKVCNTEKNDMVLDYFAGSGTTGHAVINLNRIDKEGGNRRYILIEMGEYFKSVTLPRMKKVVYSPEWETGKPQDRNSGVSHLMKYITLESYEDTLSNIELDDDLHRLMEFIGDDYILNP